MLDAIAKAPHFNVNEAWEEVKAERRCERTG